MLPYSFDVSTLNKDSSESSIEQDQEFIDEQESDQQSQNNQTSSMTTVAGNTLPMKSTGNAARSVT